MPSPWIIIFASSANSATADLETTDNLDVVIDTDEGNDNDGLIDDIQAWVDGDDNQGWRFQLAEENAADNARLLRPGLITIDWTDDSQPDFLINGPLFGLDLL